MEIIKSLKDKVKALKTELVAIYMSMSDSRTPMVAKLMIALTVSYAVSPVDLIPDFIPVIGLLDDLIILPLMITVTKKLIPKEVLFECRLKAHENEGLNKKSGIYAALVIILLWLGLLVYIVTAGMN